MSHGKGETFELRIRVKPTSYGTPISRLRMALKCLLRSWDIVCERIVQLDEQGEPVTLPVGSADGSGGVGDR